MAEVALTDEMREAFATSLTTGAVPLVATASKDGMPDMAFKASIMVWDTDHVAFWERAHGMTLRSMQENPNVCLLYRNAATRQAWKMWGVAELLSEGEVRQAIMDKTLQIELDRDPERKGIAVLIRIDKVAQAGQTIMERGS
jgi:predicted pyridoxine 5'-phosphate oxidase superfamily flavin-nucleotide-binding protein